MTAARGVATPSDRPGPPDSPPAGLDRIVLLLANSTEQGIAFHRELDRPRGATTSSAVVHVLSRPAEQWHGRRGHIDEQLLSAELGDPRGWNFYLSGPPSMVRSMGDLLTAWGADPAAMRMERFEGYE